MRFTYSLRKMAKLFANSEDPDQMPHSAASDLGLHCLPITLLRVSQLQWVKGMLETYRQQSPGSIVQKIDHERSSANIPYPLPSSTGSRSAVVSY